MALEACKSMLSSLVNKLRLKNISQVSIKRAEDCLSRIAFTKYIESTKTEEAEFELQHAEEALLPVLLSFGFDEEAVGFAINRAKYHLKNKTTETNFVFIKGGECQFFVATYGMSREGETIHFVIAMHAVSFELAPHATIKEKRFLWFLYDKQVQYEHRNLTQPDQLALETYFCLRATKELGSSVDIESLPLQDQKILMLECNGLSR